MKTSTSRQLQDETQTEHASKQAFARLRQSEVEPNPFLKSRIMARLDAEPTATPLLEKLTSRRWAREAFALGLLAFALTLAAVIPQPATQVEKQAQATTEASGLVARALTDYVIKADLGTAAALGAVVAEIELPESVHFVSRRHPEIAAKRKLSLPIHKRLAEQKRLPFVVRSKDSGLKKMKLRLYDDKGTLVEERMMAVNFAQQ